MTSLRQPPSCEHYRNQAEITPPVGIRLHHPGAVLLRFGTWPTLEHCHACGGDTAKIITGEPQVDYHDVICLCGTKGQIHKDNKALLELLNYED